MLQHLRPHSKGRNQLFISGVRQFSWNFIRWRHRAYATVIQLFRKRSQIKFSSQHFRKRELFSFNQDADRTIRTEEKLVALYKHMVPYSGATGGWSRGDGCPRAQHFGGAKLRSECYVLITKCQMSVDANNYNLQNVECYSAISARLWFGSRLHHLTLSESQGCKLSYHFIVASQWDRNPISQCLQCYNAHDFRAAMKLTQCCYQGCAEGGDEQGKGPGHLRQCVIQRAKL